MFNKIIQKPVHIQPVHTMNLVYVNLDIKIVVHTLIKTHYRFVLNVNHGIVLIVNTLNLIHDLLVKVEVVILDLINLEINVIVDFEVVINGNVIDMENVIGKLKMFVEIYNNTDLNDFVVFLDKFFLLNDLNLI